jgi:NADH:ubiquinone oxidoreductase subunit 2 (subunit N)
MRTTITLIIAFIALLYASGITIKFNPVSIEFKNLALGFALFFLWISISLFQYQSYKQGKIDKFNEIVEAINELKNETK